MGHKYPSNFPIAIILLVLVLTGATYSLLHKRHQKIEKLQPVQQSADSIVNSDTFNFNLENQSNDLENFETVRVRDSVSPSQSCWLKDDVEFSVAFTKRSNEILGYENQKRVTFSFSIFATVPLKGAKVVYSLTMEDGKDADWQSMELVTDPVSWKKVEYSFLINDEFRKGNGKIKLYVWNMNKENFRIDDLEINFKK